MSEIRQNIDLSTVVPLSSNITFRFVICLMLFCSFFSLSCLCSASKFRTFLFQVLVLSLTQSQIHWHCCCYCCCCQVFSQLWDGLSDEVLVWLSVWREVQIVCVWSSQCHCIPKPHNLSPHLNSDWFYLSGTGLLRLFWKEAVKRVVVAVVVWDGLAFWSYRQTHTPVQRPLFRDYPGELVREK